jgi:NADH-quinone oxidoreductase subunit N
MIYLDLLKLAAPETILTLTVLAVLAADLLALRELELRLRFLIGGMIASFGCAAAIAWMLVMPEHGDFMGGMLVVNPLTQTIKIALLVFAILTILLSLESNFTPHAGEYLALVLLATVGMLFLVSAQDILMIFISLELTSLSLYILTGFDKRSPQSAEAALKYFLFGGMSAAFTLFGLSLLYGLSGATNLGQIAAAIRGPKLDPMLLLAVLMTLAGFGFKVAAAPFHLWAPDTYQGAPVPSAAFIASGSKVAGFFILAQVTALGFKGAEGSGAWGACSSGWVPVLAGLAAVSMVLGNLAAIVQSSVRRLLAYSAIAHAGYMLLGVIPRGQAGLVSLVYYVLTYALTTLGAFGVVAIVKDQTGGDRLADFAGLSRRAPVLAFCMMIFMLSLAGIPPLAGFFGKFYVFSSVLGEPSAKLGLLWLVVLALGLSVVSLYYYLQVLKQVYVAAPALSEHPVKVPPMSLAVVVISALGVVIFGCAPSLLLEPIAAAVKLAFP